MPFTATSVIDWAVTHGPTVLTHGGAWATLAVVLLLLELFTGTMVGFALGIAAGIVAATLGVTTLAEYDPHWALPLVVFAAVSWPVMTTLRGIVKRRRQAPDPNVYDQPRNPALDVVIDTRADPDVEPDGIPDAKGDPKR